MVSRRLLSLSLALATACAPGGPVASATSAPAASLPSTPTPAARATSAECGKVLTESFTLAHDLECGGDALIAGADGITIDLNGKTLRGPGMGPQTWPSPQLDSVGVRVEGRSRVVVRNGKTTHFSTGVYLQSATKSVVESVTSERSRYGVYIFESSGNAILRNNVNANVYGLHLQRSHDNVIQGNQLVRQTYNSPGGYGIYLFASERNRVFENTIEKNINWGIWSSEAKNNTFFHNNVIGNSPQVSDNSSSGNHWYDAATKRGNHWADYDGKDTNGDGIGDTGPYRILGPAEVVDPYPFVERDGWKKHSGPTIHTYVARAPRAPKQVRVLALTADGVVHSAAPADARASATAVRGTSIALQSDGRTLYALDGRRLEVWDAVSGASTVRDVAVADGAVAANRDGRSALVVGPRGAQQIDTRTGVSEFFAYARQPRGIAPSYKHNHIFVGTSAGLDLFYLNLGGRTPYTIPLSGPAMAIAMNGSGTRVYVLIAGDADTRLIEVVDTEQYTVVSRIPLRGSASALAVSPREDRLYVGTTSGVDAIALADGRVLSSATFLGAVVDLAVSPNGDELYAALAGQEQGIAVLRTADLTRANIIPLTAAPSRLLVASY